MRVLLFAVLLAGCSGMKAPVPPAPALASVTFVWTPIACADCQQIFDCEGLPAVTLPISTGSYTLSLPPGEMECSLDEMDGQILSPDASWAGTVRLGSQTVALRLGTA